MIQLTNSGMTYQGDADFNGKPFSVGWTSPVFYALGAVATAQAEANGVNQIAVKTYNDAMTTANASFGGTPPPATVPKMQVVPDYLSDAIASNPIGTSGQPIQQTADFPAGTLLAAAKAPVVTPSAVLSTASAQPPAYIMDIMAILTTIKAAVVK